MTTKTVNIYRYGISSEFGTIEAGIDMSQQIYAHGYDVISKGYKYFANTDKIDNLSGKISGYYWYVEYAYFWSFSTVKIRDVGTRFAVLLTDKLSYLSAEEKYSYIIRSISLKSRALSTTGQYLYNGKNASLYRYKAGSEIKTYYDYTLAQVKSGLKKDETVFMKISTPQNSTINGSGAQNDPHKWQMLDKDKCTINKNVWVANSDISVSASCTTGTVSVKGSGGSKNVDGKTYKYRWTITITDLLSEMVNTLSIVVGGESYDYALEPNVTGETEGFVKISSESQSGNASWVGKGESGSPLTMSKAVSPIIDSVIDVTVLKGYEITSASSTTGLALSIKRNSNTEYSVTISGLLPGKTFLNLVVGKVQTYTYKLSVVDKYGFGQIVGKTVSYKLSDMDGNHEATDKAITDGNEIITLKAVSQVDMTVKVTLKSVNFYIDRVSCGMAITSLTHKGGGVYEVKIEGMKPTDTALNVYIQENTKYYYSLSANVTNKKSSFSSMSCITRANEGTGAPASPWKWWSYNATCNFEFRVALASDRCYIESISSTLTATKTATSDTKKYNIKVTGLTGTSIGFNPHQLAITTNKYATQTVKVSVNPVNVPGIGNVTAPMTCSILCESDGETFSASGTGSYQGGAYNATYTDKWVEDSLIWKFTFDLNPTVLSTLNANGRMVYLDEVVIGMNRANAAGVVSYSDVAYSVFSGVNNVYDVDEIQWNATNKRLTIKKKLYGECSDFKIGLKFKACRRVSIRADGNSQFSSFKVWGTALNPAAQLQLTGTSTTSSEKTSGTATVDLPEGSTFQVTASTASDWWIPNGKFLLLGSESKAHPTGAVHSYTTANFTVGSSDVEYKLFSRQYHVAMQWNLSGYGQIWFKHTGMTAWTKRESGKGVAVNNDKNILAFRDDVTWQFKFVPVETQKNPYAYMVQGWEIYKQANGYGDVGPGAVRLRSITASDAAYATHGTTAEKKWNPKDATYGISASQITDIAVLCRITQRRWKIEVAGENDDGTKCPYHRLVKTDITATGVPDRTTGLVAETAYCNPSTEGVRVKVYTSNPMYRYWKTVASESNYVRVVDAANHKFALQAVNGAYKDTALTVWSRRIFKNINLNYSGLVNGKVVLVVRNKSSGAEIRRDSVNGHSVPFNCITEFAKIVYEPDSHYEVDNGASIGTIGAYMQQMQRYTNPNIPDAKFESDCCFDYKPFSTDPNATENSADKIVKYMDATVTAGAHTFCRSEFNITLKVMHGSNDVTSKYELVIGSVSGASAYVSRANLKDVVIFSCVAKDADQNETYKVSSITVTYNDESGNSVVSALSFSKEQKVMPSGAFHSRFYSTTMICADQTITFNLNTMSHLVTINTSRIYMDFISVTAFIDGKRVADNAITHLSTNLAHYFSAIEGKTVRLEVTAKFGGECFGICEAPCAHSGSQAPATSTSFAEFVMPSKNVNYTIHSRSKPSFQCRVKSYSDTQSSDALMPYVVSVRPSINREIAVASTVPSAYSKSVNLYFKERYVAELVRVAGISDAEFERRKKLMKFSAWRVNRIPANTVTTHSDTSYMFNMTDEKVKELEIAAKFIEIQSRSVSFSLAVVDAGGTETTPTGVPSGKGASLKVVSGGLDSTGTKYYDETEMSYSVVGWLEETMRPGAQTATVVTYVPREVKVKRGSGAWTTLMSWDDDEMTRSGGFTVSDDTQLKFIFDVHTLEGFTVMRVNVDDASYDPGSVSIHSDEMREEYYVETRNGAEAAVRMLSPVTVMASLKPGFKFIGWYFTPAAWEPERQYSLLPVCVIPANEVIAGMPTLHARYALSSATVNEWNADKSEVKPMLWRSKVFAASSYYGMSSLAVYAEKYPATVTCYASTSPFYTADAGRSACKVVVNSQDAVRIPKMPKEKYFIFEVSGEGRINHVAIGSSMEALR